jgi:protein-disulfide isomerase
MNNERHYTIGLLTGALLILTACTQQSASPKIHDVVDNEDVFILGYNTIGEDSAPITFVEYSDYQCPFCRKFTVETLPQIIEKYVETGVVRFIFKDFPLEIHTEAFAAAVAAHCAGEQEQYFLYHDLLFVKAADRGEAFTEESFLLWAKELGLDADLFASCLQDETQHKKVRDSIAEAKRIGIKGTPSFLVNNKLLMGAQPFAAFAQIIDQSTNTLPSIKNALCTTNEDCPPARSFPQYCSQSVSNEICTTTGTPTCKLPGTAESECVMIITEECLPCPKEGQCIEDTCGLVE